MRLIAGADDEADTFTRAVDAFTAAGWQVEVLPISAWPDVAEKVAAGVESGEFDAGLLMCWTGTGTSMMANRFRGVRAALCWEPWIADGSRRYNDANVLVMSLKRTSPDQAEEIVKAWLAVEDPDPDEIANIQRLSGI